MAAKLMDKEQNDLFNQYQTADKQIRKKTRFLLPPIKNSITLSYETVVFSAVAFLMSCIIFFSLGVEKGKHMANDKKNNIGISVVPTLVEPGPNIDKDELKKDTLDNQPAKKIFNANRYVVQLVSFKKKEHADTELAKLKKQGYNAYIKQTGDYYGVFIGHFDSKQKAVKVMNTFKFKYKDCAVK